MFVQSHGVATERSAAFSVAAPRLRGFWLGFRGSEDATYRGRPAGRQGVLQGIAGRPHGSGVGLIGALGNLVERLGGFDKYSCGNQAWRRRFDGLWPVPGGLH